MVSLIIGSKGSGKTKFLLGKVDEAIEKSNGNVIVVEKEEEQLTYDVNYRARLVVTDTYSVTGFDALYGFLSGVCAGDHDITDIFVDATLRIANKDFEALADFLQKVDALSKISDTQFTFTISTDLENLPERMFKYCEKIN